MNSPAPHKSPPKPRRIKYVVWNSFAMKTLLTCKDWMRQANNLPADLQIVGVERTTFFDKTDYNELVYLLHSKTFEPVPYGEKIPELILFFEVKPPESK